MQVQQLPDIFIINAWLTKPKRQRGESYYERQHVVRSRLQCANLLPSDADNMQKSGQQSNDGRYRPFKPSTSSCYSSSLGCMQGPPLQTAILSANRLLSFYQAPSFKLFICHDRSLDYYLFSMCLLYCRDGWRLGQFDNADRPSSISAWPIW